MSRAITAEEAREDFLNHIHALVEYWANLPDHTDKEKCDGLAFSILVTLDGESADLPALDLLLSPHPDDKQFHIDEDEDWYESGMMINDCALHELWYNR